MIRRRKVLIQTAVAVVVAAALLGTAPTAPARKLAIAINYTYHRVLPGIAADGLP
jgi:hypothetical protein